VISRVQVLDLPYFQVHLILLAADVLRSAGRIPPELGGLTAMKNLNLWSNRLTGEWPGGVSVCTVYPADRAPSACCSLESIRANFFKGIGGFADRYRSLASPFTPKLHLSGKNSVIS